MEPIIEAVIEILRDRGEFRNEGEIRMLIEAHDEWNEESLYEAYLGPAISKIEDDLMERRTEEEQEARA